MSTRGISIAFAAALIAAGCSTAPELAPPPGSSGSSSMSGTGSAAGSATAPTVADQQFITMATYSGLGEVALGRMAQERGSSSTVKAIGARMVGDHTRVNQELAGLARQKGVTPPTSPDPGRMAVADALGDLSGTNFDAQYLQQQLAEHQVAIALFETQAQNGADRDLRALAQRTLPALREHARMIEQALPSRVSSGTAPSATERTGSGSM